MTQDHSRADPTGKEGGEQCGDHETANARYKLAPRSARYSGGK